MFLMVEDNCSMCFSWSKISCIVRDRWDLKLVWAEFVSAIRCWNDLEIQNMTSTSSLSLFDATPPVGVDPVLLYVVVLSVEDIIHICPQPLRPWPRSWNVKMSQGAWNGSSPWEACKLFCEKWDQVSGMLRVVSIFSMPPWRLIPLQRILKCKVVKCFRELSTESCYGIPGRYGLCSGLNPCCWGQALTGVLRSDLSWSVGWPAKTKFVRDPKPKHVIIENDIQSSIDLWACSECWQSGLILDRVGPLRHPWLGLSPSCSLSCRCSRWLLGGVDLSLWERAQVDLWGTNDNLKLSHSMFYFPRSTLFSSSCWSHSCSCPARRWALTAS